MHEDVKKNGKLHLARPTGQIENGKHSKYSDKKKHTGNFMKIVRVVHIKHFRVHE